MFKRVGLQVMSAALLVAAPAHAAVLLDVGGLQDQAYRIAPGTAAAVAFTLEHAAKNVSITAPIFCIGCSGGIWLNRDKIGPAAGLGMTLAGASFSSRTPTPYFAFDELDAGTYYFITAIDGSSTGSALWAGSSNLQVSGDAAYRVFDFTADDLRPWAPLSDFRVTFGLGLNYTLALAAVPEPDTWAMMIIGFGAVGVAMRRRKYIGSVRLV